MSGAKAATQVKVLSGPECQALLEEEPATTDANTAALPVSESTWHGYYNGQLPAIREPWYIHRDRSKDEATALILIEPTLHYFAGHFPNQPLLPGVVQLNWAVQLAAELLPSAYAAVNFAGLARVKFKAPVLPGAIVQFQLRPEPGRIALNIASHAGVHTQGRLRYRG